MTSQAFYRKWRPQTLGDVVGQEPVTRTLLNALKNDGISHAYLFCGPRGTGKTSTGRILAKAVNCLTSEGKDEPCNTCEVCRAITAGSSMDVIEVDAASNRGIDEIRGLREKVSYAPSQSRYKVYIIDEVHMLTKEASNALLKTLEEPPPYVIFVLATTEAHKVLATILSRCQRFDFRRLSQADIAGKLAAICKAENIDIQSEALHLVAKTATGSLRDAENLLQQLTTYYGATIEIQQVQSTLGISGDWRSRELASQIIDNDIPGGIVTINSVNNDGLDLRQFRRELVEYLRLLLLVKTGSGDTLDLAAEDREELNKLSVRASLEQVLRAVKRFGEFDIRLDNYHTLPLELALVDCVLASMEGAPRQAAPPPAVTAGKKTPPPAPPQMEKPAPQTLKTVEQPPEIKAEPGPGPVPAGRKIEKPEAALPEPPEEEITGEEIERLSANWLQIIKDAPANIARTPVAALLRSARPKAVQGETVILSFKFPFHKEKMETLENQRIAEKLIGNFLKRSCRVQCIHEPDENHLVNAALKIGAIIDSEEQ